MVTLALAMHATDETGTTLPYGHTYLLFETEHVVACRLLVMKVEAEFRKANMAKGGFGATCLSDLAGFPVTDGEQQTRINVKGAVLNRFIRGDLQVQVDGVFIPPDLNYPIPLNNRTVLRVVVPSRKVHDDTSTPYPNFPGDDPFDALDPDPGAMGSSKRR